MSLPSREWLGYAIVTQTYSHFAFCSLFRQETDSVESLESINTELQFSVYFNPPSHRGTVSPSPPLSPPLSPPP